MLFRSTSYSGNNFTRWKDLEYDRLIEEAAGEALARKRVALYDTAQRMLTEKAVAIVPLFVDSINILVHPSVHGLQIDSLGLLKIHHVEMK